MWEAISSHMKTEIDNDVLIIIPEGKVDTSTSPELENVIFENIEKGYKRIVVDMGETDYMSSAGIRVLLKAAKQLPKLNGRILLANTNDRVQDVLNVSGLMSLIVSWGTREEAVRSASDG